MKNEKESLTNGKTYLIYNKGHDSFFITTTLHSVIHAIDNESYVYDLSSLPRVTKAEVILKTDQEDATNG